MGPKAWIFTELKQQQLHIIMMLWRRSQHEAFVNKVTKSISCSCEPNIFRIFTVGGVQLEQIA